MKNVLCKLNIISGFDNIVIAIFTIFTKLWLCIYSPIYAETVTDRDGAIFTLIGKSLLSGKVLYKNIFDHKTPYIYFFNAIGMLFPYRHIGLFIIECVLLYEILYYAYKISNLFIDNTNLSLFIIAILSFILTIPQISFSYSKTETYAVAFFVPTVYIFLKTYLNNIKMRNFEIIICGTLGALTLMSNIKAAILFLPFGIAYLFFRKNIKENIIFVLLIFLGVFVSILPYFIYAILTNSFSDFIFAVFNFNSKYFISERETILTFIETYASVNQIPLLCFIILMIFIPLLVLIKINFNKYCKYPILFSLILAIFYTFVGGRPYPYYFVIFMPFTMIVSICIVKKFNFKITKSFALLFLFITLLLNILVNFKNVNSRAKNDIYLSTTITESIKKTTNKNISDLNLYCIGCFPEGYVYTNATPQYKYFFMPLISYKEQKEPYLEMYKTIIRCEPDIILYKLGMLSKRIPKNMLNDINIVLSTSYKTIYKENIGGYDYMVLMRK